MSEQENTLTLPEAMREGCKGTKLRTHSLYFFDGNGKVTQCCGLGAAAIGGGLEPVESGNYAQISLRFPDLRLDIELPCEHSITTDDGLQTIQHGIIHLVDRHGWTREAVADWVEKVLKGDA